MQIRVIDENLHNCILHQSVALGLAVILHMLSMLLGYYMNIERIFNNSADLEKLVSILSSDNNWRLRAYHSWLPQGAVLSPTLFNFYVAEFPKLECKVTTFADDITLYDTAVDIEESEIKLTRDLAKIVDWAKSLALDISPQKSSVTQFTPSTHEFH